MKIPTLNIPTNRQFPLIYRGEQSRSFRYKLVYPASPVYMYVTTILAYQVHFSVVLKRQRRREVGIDEKRHVYRTTGKKHVHNQTNANYRDRNLVLFVDILTILNFWFYIQYNNKYCLSSSSFTRVRQEKWYDLLWRNY